MTIATAKQNQGVERCRKIPKLFHSFDRPLQIGVGLRSWRPPVWRGPKQSCQRKLSSAHNHHFSGPSGQPPQTNSSRRCPAGIFAPDLGCGYAWACEGTCTIETGQSGWLDSISPRAVRVHCRAVTDHLICITLSGFDLDDFETASLDDRLMSRTCRTRLYAPKRHLPSAIRTAP
jgi:hypothetical protein